MMIRYFPSRTVNVLGQINKITNSQQKLVNVGSFCNHVRNEMFHWQRPSGPLNVWKVVNGYDTLADGLKKPVKFSIQEIPNENDRKKEVYDFLINHFLVQEALCKFTNIKEDPDGIESYLLLWNYGMEQGITQGCYKLNSHGGICELVGLMMLHVETEETIEYFKEINSNCKSDAYKKILTFREIICSNVNLYEKYQVDQCMVMQSLSVSPSYQGCCLGYHIVDTSYEASKKYGVNVTRGICSAEAAQHLSQLFNFEVLASVELRELVDDQKNLLFPNIDSKTATLVAKKFF